MAQSDRIQELMAMRARAQGEMQQAEAEAESEVEHGDSKNSRIMIVSLH